MLNKNKFTTLHPSVVGLSDVSDIKEVAEPESVEDSVLSKDLLAWFSVNPGAAHVIRWEKSKSREHKELKKGKLVVCTSKNDILLLDSHEANDTKGKGRDSDVVEEGEHIVGPIRIEELPLPDDFLQQEQEVESSHYDIKEGEKRHWTLES